MSEHTEAGGPTPGAGTDLSLRSESRRWLMLLVGVGVLLIGSYLTLAMLRQARTADLAYRFTLAVEQLRKPDLTSRLTGIHLLDDLATTSDGARPRVAEILSAYVRDHATIGEDALPHAASGAHRLREDLQAALWALSRRPTAFVLDDRQRMHLARTDLRYADLAGAHLEGVVLSDAWLVGADLTEAHLEGAVLRRARLDDASLAAASLMGASLAQANLEGASLRGAALDEAYLARARLDGANLLDTDLRRAFGLTWDQVARARRGQQTRFPETLGGREPAQGAQVR